MSNMGQESVQFEEQDSGLNINVRAQNEDYLNNNDGHFMRKLLKRLGIRSSRAQSKVLVLLSVILLVVAGAIFYLFVWSNENQGMSAKNLTQSELSKLPPEIRNFIKSHQNK